MKMSLGIKRNLLLHFKTLLFTGAYVSFSVGLKSSFRTLRAFQISACFIADRVGNCCTASLIEQCVVTCFFLASWSSFLEVWNSSQVWITQRNRVFPFKIEVQSKNSLRGRDVIDSVLRNVWTQYACCALVQFILPWHWPLQGNGTCTVGWAVNDFFSKLNWRPYTKVVDTWNKNCEKKSAS